MRREWVTHPSFPEAQALADALGLPPILGQLLCQRGMASPTAAQRFLACDLADAADPFLLTDMDQAVARLRQAIARGERICVVSDYDVDGVTSTALLVRVLTRLGAAPLTYVPHRVRDGYGFNRKAVEFAKAQQAAVVITVDSGTTAHEALRVARTQGVDVIVVDHHEMAPPPAVGPSGRRSSNAPPAAGTAGGGVAHLTRPPAYALINPLQAGCRYPDKDLASVGLAFKLAQALSPDAGSRDALWEHLDLVCLGTVADVAPLTGENRILVHHGLKRLRATAKAGLKALMAAADLRVAQLSTEHVGFILGPRINAAGRMSAADRALRLLLTDEPAEAATLAQALHEENRLRQRVEEATLREAVEKVEREINFNQHRVIVVDGEGWHPGVIGIVASRLVERYHRPSIVVAVADGMGRGSARSIQRFHLVEALGACQSWLQGFGGHEAAAGLTIAQEHLPAFREAINTVAQGRLAPEALIPRLAVDAEVPLGQVTPSLIASLERLGPFGAGNPRPVFASHGLALRAKPQPLGRGGVRCWVRAPEGPVFEASGFDRADRWRDRLHAMTGAFSLAYAPVLRTWQGEPAVQLQIKDVREAEG